MSESALLLDSNIVVWLDQRPDRLPPNIVRQIALASKVYVSAVTAWELGIKQALGSLSLTRSVSEIIEISAMMELPVTVRHGEAVRYLPRHHNDPFDRLLLVQAQIEGLVLVSADQMLLKYGVPMLLA